MKKDTVKIFVLEGANLELMNTWEDKLKEVGLKNIVVTNIPPVIIEFDD